jgi:serine/threonine protein kinase
MFELIGKTVGPYRIIEQIGSGGMATVYKAYHPNMDRYVAVKVLPQHLSKDPDFAKRFQREARAIARLEHSHILPVYDYGEYEGITYIAMRYIKAGTLKDRMSAGRLSLEEINNLIGQIGSALDYAHRMGVIHRDIKPANILIDDQGDTYLSDFGLARMMEASQQLTVSGVGLGTPSYMSPEQGQGNKVDHRSDIYSLGIILYELLTGRVPYEAETPMAVVHKHIQGDLPLPHTINPNTPEAIERVILKALAREPADRYQTAGEMVQALHTAVRLLSAEAQQQTMVMLDKTVPVQQHTSIVAKIQSLWKQRWGRVMLAGGGLVVVLLLGLSLSRLPGNITILAPNGYQHPSDAITTPTREQKITENSLAPAAANSDAILVKNDFEDGRIQKMSVRGEWKIVSDGTENHVIDIDNSKGSDWPGIGMGSNGWDNYKITFRVKFLSEKSISSLLYFRVSSDANDKYALSMDENATNLNYVTSAANWTPIEGSNYKLTPLVWHTVQVEANSNKLKVSVDDALLIDTNDSQFSKGSLEIEVGPGTHAQFDDILVVAIASIEASITPSSATQTGKLIFEDSFEDGFSHGFNYWEGSWSVVEDNTGNKVLETKSGASGSSSTLSTPNFSDGIIEIRFRVISGINPIVTLTFRLNSSSDWIDYKVVYDKGSLNLYYQDKGTWKPVQASSGGGTIQAAKGDWITLRLVAQGENIKVFADGKLIITALDSRLKTGEINIGTFPNMVTQFDDIKVSELVTPTVNISDANILFDETHGGTSIDPGRAAILNPNNPEYAYVGPFVREIKNTYTLDALLEGPITSDVLNNHQVLILTGYEWYTPQEAEAVLNFVRKGGGLLIVGEGGGFGNLSLITKPMGVILLGGPIASEAHRGDFKVKVNSSSDLLKDVSEITIHWASAIEVKEPAIAILSTDANTWNDLNYNEKIESNEERGPFQIAAQIQFGKGRVVIFPNTVWGGYFNGEATFLMQALAWLAGK